MELREYLAVLWRRRWVVAVTCAVTLLITVIGIFTLPSTYVASTTLRIATLATQSSEYVSFDSIMYAGRLLNTYSRIATSESVQKELANRLAVSETPRIKADVPANSELLHLSVEHAKPVFAASAANTLAEIMIARARILSIESSSGAHAALSEQLAQAEAELEQARNALPALGPNDRTEAWSAAARLLALREERYARVLEQYQRSRAAEIARANAITVVEPAAVPDSPSNTRKPITIAIGLIVGLIGGIGLSFLFETLDTRLRSAKVVEDVLDLSILGTIPMAPRRWRGSLFEIASPQHEAFRRIRAHILNPSRGAPRTLLVTSAEPGEGKSTVVANLARAFAQAGRTVLVVDGDLRLPTLHRVFNLPNEAGLSTVLREEATWDEVTQDSSLRRVAVLTSGPLPADAAELLGSAEMARLFEQLTRWFEIVLIDTPSLLAVSDAAVLAPLVDEVALVVACGHASPGAARAARGELVNVGARSIGVIVNRAEPARSYTYYQRSAVS